MRLAGDSVYYLINPHQDAIKFEEVFPEDLYDNSRSGFVRKAIVAENYSHEQGRLFTDPSFKLPKSQDYFLVRLADMYHQEVPLFPEDESDSAFIQRQQRYCSFMGESSVISFGYLQTLFITQMVNKQGYYQYFIKRQGEYFLCQCDDYIPVDRRTWKPLWGLSLEHPWQIVLLKAWIKECGGWEEIFKAPPFSFLDAFGFPSYKVFNFRKEIRFLKQSKPLKSKNGVEEAKKNPLRNRNSIIIAKSANSPSLSKVGLIPNQACFRIMHIHDQDEGELRVFCGVPCAWIGEHTAVANTNLNTMYPDRAVDLERSFLMTEQQVLTYFDKFYAAPFNLADPEDLVLQDCQEFISNGIKELWLAFDCNHDDGLLALSIELKEKSKRKGIKYAGIRCLLVKKKSPQEIHQSHIRMDKDYAELIGEGYNFAESICDKWDLYAIDYMQGYHSSLTFFTKLEPGAYRLFVHIDEPIKFNLRFDSQVNLTQPVVVHPSMEEKREIFQSTFFSISQDDGITVNLKQKRKGYPEEFITLNDSFQELGFGSIAIKTLQKAHVKIAMRVYPKKLEAEGFRILDCYEHLVEEVEGESSFVLSSEKGRPEVLVLERTPERMRESRLEKEFPPREGIQFFKVSRK